MPVRLFGETLDQKVNKPAYSGRQQAILGPQEMEIQGSCLIVREDLLQAATLQMLSQQECRQHDNAASGKRRIENAGDQPPGQ